VFKPNTLSEIQRRLNDEKEQYNFTDDTLALIECQQGHPG
jgi:hypothetical protein